MGFVRAILGAVGWKVENGGETTNEPSFRARKQQLRSLKDTVLHQRKPPIYGYALSQLTKLLFSKQAMASITAILSKPGNF